MYVYNIDIFGDIIVITLYLLSKMHNEITHFWYYVIIWRKKNLLLQILPLLLHPFM